MLTAKSQSSPWSHEKSIAHCIDSDSSSGTCTMSSLKLAWPTAGLVPCYLGSCTLQQWCHQGENLGVPLLDITVHGPLRVSWPCIAGLDKVCNFSVSRREAPSAFPKRIGAVPCRNENKRPEKRVFRLFLSVLGQPLRHGDLIQKLSTTRRSQNGLRFRDLQACGRYTES